VALEKTEGDLYLIRGEVTDVEEDEIVLDLGERSVRVLLDGHLNPVADRQPAQVRGPPDRLTAGACSGGAGELAVEPVVRHDLDRLRAGGLGLAHDEHGDHHERSQQDEAHRADGEDGDEHGKHSSWR
jgi:hypothetical protein